MARIRSIHPGILTDEAYMSLTVEQPLAIALLLGLLMESDDYGVFEWKPMTIKARILPAVTLDVGVLLQALVDHRFIAPFEVDGRKLGAVRNFCRFQKPKKPNAMHPRTPEMDRWVGNGSAPVSEPGGIDEAPVPNRFPTEGEKSRQMEDGDRRMEDGGGGGGGVAAAAPRSISGLEADCRRIVGEAGPEPCLVDPNFVPILALLDEGLTEDDVRTGIAEALQRADPGYRFRFWRDFAKWIRTAAKNRLGSGPRARPGAGPPRKPDPPDDPRIEFGGGWSTLLSKAVRAERDGTWNRDEWGPRIGEAGCRVPERFRSAFEAAGDCCPTERAA